MEKDELNENIDKALYNIEKLIGLKKDEEILLLKLYIGMIQRKHGDIDVMIVTPLELYRDFNYSREYKGTDWDIKPAINYSELKEKQKQGILLVIGKRKGVIAELNANMFKRIMNGKQKIKFRGKDRELDAKNNIPGIPGKGESK